MHCMLINKVNQERGRPVWRPRHNLHLLGRYSVGDRHLLIRMALAVQASYRQVFRPRPSIVITSSIAVALTIRALTGRYSVGDRRYDYLRPPTAIRCAGGKGFHQPTINHDVSFLIRYLNNQTRSRFTSSFVV